MKNARVFIARAIHCSGGDSVHDSLAAICFLKTLQELLSQTYTDKKSTDRDRNRRKNIVHSKRRRKK